MKIYINPLQKEDFNPLFFCPRTYFDIILSGFQSLYEDNKVELMTEPDNETYIIYCQVPHDRGIKYSNKSLQYLADKYLDKLIIIDNSDENNKFYFPPELTFLYFKRSLYKWDENFNRSYIEQTSNVRFFTYGITPGMSLYYNIPYGERPIDVGCYLRPSEENRNRVLGIMQQIHNLRPQWNMHIGPVTTSSRSDGKNTVYDRDYFSILQQTKISIVCQPPWIGSSREWESLSQQCVTFIDSPFIVPSEYPENLNNYVEYSPNNPNHMLQNLDQLLNQPSKAAYIAQQGYEWATKTQTSKDRCQHIVNCIEAKFSGKREIVLST